MAGNTRGQRLHHLRSTPYPSPSYSWKSRKDATQKKASLNLEKRDWEDATCAVCMEYPHNAVLLLCSSHDQGCRPYMCQTSYRHSNCLNQFKKAYTKVASLHHGSAAGGPSLTFESEKSDVTRIACPLCRGQVKGWTVVEPAREYLNSKKRTCMQDGCSFIGSYKELREHVRSEHPSARPREVDPAVEQKWRTLEYERERQDVISTIRSSTPRAVVFGDYAIEMGNIDSDSDEELGNVDGSFGGGSRGIGRNILYFFLREGARLMRLNRDNDASEGREEDTGYIPMTGSGDATDDNEADLVINEGGDTGMLESERQRRRRRRRSRGRLVLGAS